MHYLPEFAQTHIHWVSDATQTSHSLLPPSSPALNLSQHQSLSNESALRIWWTRIELQLASASVLKMNIHIWFPSGLTGLVSFAVQRTLKSFLQHHIWEASIFWCPTFFMGQLSHLNMTTGKSIVLTVQTFVGKMMSMFCNMLLKFVIAFLPRSKHLLILWLKSPSAVILEPKKTKSVTVSSFSLSICHELMGLDAMIFILRMLNLKSAFSLTSFTFIKKLFASSSLTAIRVLLPVVVDITFSSVTQSCPNLWDPVDCRMPGFSVHHQLLELIQTHSCSLSWWCHPTISSSVVPFSSRLQSFPASRSFQMSQFFT